VLIEIFLRVIPNPFDFRIKGNKIILSLNKEYRIENKKIKKLDRIIYHKKNSLGFRGEELSKDSENYLKIITIGGSTTECFYLSDDKTWTHLLGMELKNAFNRLWINNAGLDGHSTFGYFILIEDYIIKLKPGIILFLMGINDVGTKAPKLIEKEKFIRKFNFKSLKLILKSTANHSEVISLFINIFRKIETIKKEVGHREIILTENEYIEIPKETKMYMLEMHEEKYIKPYKLRLKKLIEICRKNGIEPIFINQPALYGNAIDDITNVNLAKVKIKDYNGEVAWSILDLYNDATKKVGNSEGVFVIDLAKEIPKSSKYFYDFHHFTNDGAEKVAEIIYKHLYPFLANRYNDYLKHAISPAT